MEDTMAIETCYLGLHGAEALRRRLPDLVHRLAFLPGHVHVTRDLLRQVDPCWVMTPLCHHFLGHHHDEVHAQQIREALVVAASGMPWARSVRIVSSHAIDPHELLASAGREVRRAAFGGEGGPGDPQRANRIADEWTARLERATRASTRGGLSIVSLPAEAEGEGRTAVMFRDQLPRAGLQGMELQLAVEALRLTPEAALARLGEGGEPSPFPSGGA
jgi:hypothetical protein